MALIAAVIGSVLGALLGVVSMVMFNVSFMGAFGVYVLVSLGSIVACASAMLMSSDRRLAGHSVYEDELDADWHAFEARTRRLSSDEAEFQTDLDVPLSESERREGRDRRKTDRRNTG